MQFPERKGSRQKLRPQEMTALKPHHACFNFAAPENANEMTYNRKIMQAKQGQFYIHTLSIWECHQRCLVRNAQCC